MRRPVPPMLSRPENQSQNGSDSDNGNGGNGNGKNGNGGNGNPNENGRAHEAKTESVRCPRNEIQKMNLGLELNRKQQMFWSCLFTQDFKIGPKMCTKKGNAVKKAENKMRLEVKYQRQPWTAAPFKRPKVGELKCVQEYYIAGQTMRENHIMDRCQHLTSVKASPYKGHMHYEEVGIATSWEFVHRDCKGKDTTELIASSWKDQKPRKIKAWKQERSWMSKRKTYSGWGGEANPYSNVVRADGSSKNYKIFSEMLDDFDKQDVMDLHNLVEEWFATSRPEGYDLMLWGDLKTLFEPVKEDKVWRNQQGYNLISWRLYDSCGIHILLMDNGIAIHMMIEKKCPLNQEMLSRMLSKRLEVDHESTMAYELLKFIRSQVQK
ncbi:hypothetical protein Tco_0276901 [Tanacetum coccineum]